MEPALAAEQFWRLTAEPVAVMRLSRLSAVRKAATAQVKQVQTKKTNKKRKQNKKNLVYCTRFIFWQLCICTMDFIIHIINSSIDA